MTNLVLRTSRLCGSLLVAGAIAVAGAGSAVADAPFKNLKSYNNDRYDGGGDNSQDDHRGDRDKRKGESGKQTSKNAQRSGHQEQYRANSGSRDRQYSNRGADSQYGGWSRDRQYSSRDQSQHVYRDYRRDYDGHYSRDYDDHPRVMYRGRPYVVPHERTRYYRDVVVVRPYGHWYSGYGHYHSDDDAFKWLAFTAITLGVLNYMSEAQQREYEAAQVSATTAPIGERIVWQEGGASGSVVATREGASTSGRYCREFQQNVTVGGRTEQAYGTACMNPDGTWQVVSSDTR